MRQMKKNNAYFQYKNQSLFKSKDTKADQLIQTTMKFQNEFNSLKTQMRKEDLKASRYQHRVVSYFNKPKQKIPQFMMNKDENLPTNQSENKTEVSDESCEQAQHADDNKIYEQKQKLSRNNQINPNTPKPILQQQTLSPDKQKYLPRKGHRKMVRKQQIHPGLRKDKSNYTSIGHLLRKQKQIIERERGWHQRNYKTNIQVMDAVMNTMPSSPKDYKFCPKYKMVRPTSASSLASETISLISLAVQAREKQKSSLSIAEQAKLEEEKEKKKLRKKFKQQFYYAMKNKKFQTDVFDSARERITDIPGINVRDNINVHSLHNFQQYFESVNAKAQNLVNICNYRTKQHSQGETPSQQNSKNRRMSKPQVDLVHQISLKHLKSSETLFLNEYDREKTGILSSQIGNSVEFTQYIPPGYLKKTESMSQKERQKYSINKGFEKRPGVDSQKYSSMSTTLIQSAKNFKKSQQPSTRTHKKYWSSSSNLLNGVAPNTSMWGDQKSDSLSSTRILSKAPPSRAMSFYNTPSH